MIVLTDVVTQLNLIWVNQSTDYTSMTSQIPTMSGMRINQMSLCKLEQEQRAIGATTEIETGLTWDWLVGASATGRV